MLARAGLFIISLLLSNWIYSEALIFVPELEPFGKRVMTVLRIPTHVEWPGIMTSPAAHSLGREMHSQMRESKWSHVFRAVGITDPQIQSFFSKAGLYSFGESVALRGKLESDRPYRTGAEMFEPLDPGGDLPGGYQQIAFPVVGNRNT